MKVVGYGRCSTAEQAAKGVSIEVQRRARSKHWPPTHEQESSYTTADPTAGTSR
jgi:DNA invertase Pin-like site-specific DNA recombinase